MITARESAGEPYMLVEIAGEADVTNTDKPRRLHLSEVRVGQGCARPPGAGGAALLLTQLAYVPNAIIWTDAFIPAGQSCRDGDVSWPCPGHEAPTTSNYAPIPFTYHSP